MSETTPETSDLRDRLTEVLHDAMCHHELAYRECSTKAAALLPVVAQEIAAAERVAEERGFKEAFDLKFMEHYGNASAIRDRVNREHGWGWTCSACGRPLDEEGCQYRHHDGLKKDERSRKVHLIDPDALRAYFAATPDPVAAAEQRGREAAFTGAADEPGPENSVPTPAQLLRRLFDGSAEQRIEWAHRAIENAEKIHRCFMQNHDGRIAYLEREVRELRADLAEPAPEEDK